MRETQLIENYLYRQLETSEQLLMEAKSLIDTDLQNKILWQQHTYALINDYGRLQLKKEIEAVHNKLFSEKRFAWFRRKINKIFA